MSLKQLFYAAVTARIVSWFSFIVFAVCMVMQLEWRPAVLSLGVSHLAWMLGTMFLGVFREKMAEAMADSLLQQAAQDPLLQQARQDLGSVELNELTSHPIFDEEGTND